MDREINVGDISFEITNKFVDEVSENKLNDDDILELIDRLMDYFERTREYIEESTYKYIKKRNG